MITISVHSPQVLAVAKCGSGICLGLKEHDGGAVDLFFKDGRELDEFMENVHVAALRFTARKAEKDPAE